MTYEHQPNLSPSDFAWQMNSHCDMLATYLQRLFDQVEALEHAVNR
jgi:hypothetical protein